MEDLNQYINAYESSPYQEEYVRALRRYVHFCAARKVSEQNFLELGIGHGFTLGTIAAHFKRVLVLEGAAEIVRQAENRYPNVQIIQTYFEDFTTDEKFDHIGVCAVLEHVADPQALLRKYAGFLTPRGKMFVGVPSASSLHRLLALKAGMIADLREMSAIDEGFGHKRSWTYQDWEALIVQSGLTITKAAGLAFKPFSLAQLESLRLSEKVKDAMDEFAEDYPELSNGLFFELRLA